MFLFWMVLGEFENFVVLLLGEIGLESLEN